MRGRRKRAASSVNEAKEDTENSTTSNNTEAPAVHKRGRKKKIITEKTEIEPENQNEIYKLISHTKHPFEKNHFIEGKTLTSTQRAITFCIQQNKGSANENDILSFLVTNWNVIERMGAHLATPLPDLRILRINLSVKKKDVPLFICDKNDPTIWTINEDTETKVVKKKRRFSSRIARFTDDFVSNTDSESEEVSNKDFQKDKTFNEMLTADEDSTTFEAHVFKTLQGFPEGLAIEQLSKETEKYSGEHGLFDSLPHSRRVRAVLIAKKSIGCVAENNGVWTAVEKNSQSQRNGKSYNKSYDYLPECMWLLNVTDLTLDQFYTTLKENKII